MSCWGPIPDSLVSSKFWGKRLFTNRAYPGCYGWKLDRTIAYVRRVALSRSQPGNLCHPPIGNMPIVLNSCEAGAPAANRTPRAFSYIAQCRCLGFGPGGGSRRLTSDFLFTPAASCGIRHRHPAKSIVQLSSNHLQLLRLHTSLIPVRNRKARCQRPSGDRTSHAGCEGHRQSPIKSLQDRCDKRALLVFIACQF